MGRRLRPENLRLESGWGLGKLKAQIAKHRSREMTFVSVNDSFDLLPFPIMLTYDYEISLDTLESYKHRQDLG